MSCVTSLQNGPSTLSHGPQTSKASEGCQPKPTVATTLRHPQLLDSLNSHACEKTKNGLEWQHDPFNQFSKNSAHNREEIINPATFLKKNRSSLTSEAKITPSNSDDSFNSQAKERKQRSGTAALPCRKNQIIGEDKASVKCQSKNQHHHTSCRYCSKASSVFPRIPKFVKGLKLRASTKTQKPPLPTTQKEGHKSARIALDD